MTVTAPTQQLTGMQRLSIRLRRIMLVAGLGVFAAVVGAIITGELNLRLQPKLIGAPRLITIVVGAIVWRLWVLGVLPVIGFAVGRAMRIRPVTIAFGGAIAGEIFYLMIDFATSAFETVLADLGVLALRIFTLAAGILITMRATRAGIRGADSAQASATRTAKAKRDEYAEMMREAERTADRHAAPQSLAAASAVPPAGPPVTEQPIPGEGAGAVESSAVSSDAATGTNDAGPVKGPSSAS